jgi:hypothetical protein
MQKDKFDAVRAAFRLQAKFCRALGSQLTADVLDAAAGAIEPGTAIGAKLQALTGDIEGKGDAVALRLAGGLHALARSGTDPELAEAYASREGLASAVAGALQRSDDWLAPWLDSPPQTNEAGRSANVMAGLLVAADRYPLPFDLLEIGSSAGLVLNLDHYRFDLGGTKAGDPDSPLLIAPHWTGASPPAATVQIAQTKGVDLLPIDLTRKETVERLIAYVWPDQPDRVERLEKAVALAQQFPPLIEQAEAADWIEHELADPQEAGHFRMLFHTVVMQYLSPDQQQRTKEAIRLAGERATKDRPFGWLYTEFNAVGSTFETWLHLWPDNESFHLGNAHPHGSAIDWLHG